MVKLVALTLLFTIIVVYLRNVNSELALLASIGAGIVLMFYSLEYVSNTFALFNKILEYTQIDSDLFLILFKITAIGYLVEFGAGTVKDFGLNGLADKLIFLGKIVILSVSLPVIYAVFNLILSLSL